MINHPERCVQKMPRAVQIIGLAVAWLLIVIPSASAQGTSAQRPNILWITTEDMSPDLGCYGDSYARSPHIDALAAEGARFSRAFATAPVCSPSRSSIIIGMYASAIGTHHHRSQAVPPAYVKCFTEYLRAAGYFCTNNVKTDYNFKPPPHRVGRKQQQGPLATSRQGPALLLRLQLHHHPRRPAPSIRPAEARWRPPGPDQTP